ncbi:MAG: hypothetical protein WA908_05265 [Pontixanthobacter sp.]
MTDYTTPKVPPATPPVIDEHASAKDARERADIDGDSDRPGSNDVSKADDEITRANRAISRGNAKDGAGEQELDSMTPETLLPPD